MRILSIVVDDDNEDLRVKIEQLVGDHRVGSEP